MENNLVYKMDNYKIQIRKKEYKKILENSRKRIIFNLNKKSKNTIIDKNPIEKLKIFENSLKINFDENKNFEKILEITKNINNYLELFKNSNSQIFSLLITDTKIFDLFLEITNYYSENLIEKIDNNFGLKKVENNSEKKIDLLNFTKFLNEIIDIICILTIVDFKIAKILLEKKLLDFLIFVLKNFDINLKEIIWALANLSDSEEFIFYIYKNYLNLINYIFLEFKKNLDIEHKKIFAWLFSNIFKNSKNLEKEKIENIVKTFEILKKEKNIEIKGDIIFSIQCFLFQQINYPLKFWLINLFQNLQINNFIINSLESTNHNIYYNSLKIVYFLSINTKEILEIFFNDDLKNSLINFLDNEDSQLRKICLSIINNFLLTDIFFAKKFFSNFFFHKIFYIILKDLDFNIILGLKIIDSITGDEKIDGEFIKKIFDFKIVDLLFNCFKKNKTIEIYYYIFLNFKNILKRGDDFAIEGRNFYIDQFLDHKYFEDFYDYRNSNHIIMNLKNEIDPYFDLN